MATPNQLYAEDQLGGMLRRRGLNDPWLWINRLGVEVDNAVFRHPNCLASEPTIHQDV